MKKAILVVSFGTTYRDALKRAIGSTENRIRSAFPDYEVRRAFTSRLVIKKLAERDGIHVDTEEQALERLRAEGYKEVLVQPLHVVAGDEYEKIEKAVMQYSRTREPAFERIRLGRPLLYYVGQEGEPDDYAVVMQALAQEIIPYAGEDSAVVYMGHGGLHPANSAYVIMQMKWEQAGFRHVFVYSVEGAPTFDDVIAQLVARPIKKVLLVPLMLVAGDHVINDMAGETSESAKSRLIKAGFQVETSLHGLGENAAIQDIYVRHLQDIIPAADRQPAAGGDLSSA